MSNLSGTSTKQTRAVFGCLMHPDYVDQSVWESIKRSVCRVPAIATTILNPSAKFTVPANQIARPVIPNAVYTIDSEIDESLISSRVVRLPRNRPVVYQAVTSVLPGDFDRVTIHHDELDGSFLLISDAQYCDVQLITRHTSTELKAWGKEWQFHFREVYYYPHESQTDPYLFFVGKPKYEIEVVTSGWVEDAIVADLISCYLPDIYQHKHGYAYNLLRKN